jgi:hypothetical protein
MKFCADDSRDVKRGINKKSITRGIALWIFLFSVENFNAVRQPEY